LTEQSGRDSSLILLVDDFDDAIDIYGQYLTYVGRRVVVATSGSEALAMARSKRPDVILLDISMPGLNGLDVVRILRGDRTFDSTPIVALTARALESERLEALKAGFDAVIPKPCLPDQLAAEVDKILARQGAGPRVLLVSDIDDQAVRYREILQQNGFRVSWTRTAAEAAQIADALKPACAVIDLRLPDLPGWELCKQLKAQDGLADLRLVVLTHDLDVETASHSTSIGCHAWLAQPTTAEELAGTVRHALAADTDRPSSARQAILGGMVCPACASKQVRAGVRIAAVQYYCCQRCRFCWRIDRAAV
jgi:DNA-binding response OmpR family regulator